MNNSGNLVIIHKYTLIGYKLYIEVYFLAYIHSRLCIENEKHITNNDSSKSQGFL